MSLITTKRHSNQEHDIQCRWCSQLHYTRIHNTCWIFFRLSKCVGCIKPSETSLSHIGICGVALRRVAVTIGLYSVRLPRMGATQLKGRHKTYPVKASSSPQTYCCNSKTRMLS